MDVAVDHRPDERRNGAGLLGHGVIVGTRPVQDEFMGVCAMNKLEGKVAIITGGARGMGAAHARLFRSEGAVVYLTDVLTEEGRALATEIDGTFLQHDVSSEPAWGEVVDQVLRE